MSRTNHMIHRADLMLHRGRTAEAEFWIRITARTGQHYDTFTDAASKLEKIRTARAGQRHDMDVVVVGGYVLDGVIGFTLGVAVTLFMLKERKRSYCSLDSTETKKSPNNARQ